MPRRVPDPRVLARLVRKRAFAAPGTIRVCWASPGSGRIFGLDLSERQIAPHGLRVIGPPSCVVRHTDRPSTRAGPSGSAGQSSRGKGSREQQGEKGRGGAARAGPVRPGGLGGRAWNARREVRPWILNIWTLRKTSTAEVHCMTWQRWPRARDEEVGRAREAREAATPIASYAAGPE